MSKKDMLNNELLEKLDAIASHQPVSKDGLAVMVVDMQPAYLWQVLEKNPEAYQPLISAHTNLLAYCAKEDIPVAYVEKTNETMQRVSAAIREHVMQVPRHRRITKKDLCAFSSYVSKTGPVDLLRSWNARTLCITGVYAKDCVLATAQGAAKAGFHVITARQLVADETELETSQALHQISGFGKILSHYTKLM